MTSRPPACTHVNCIVLLDLEGPIFLTCTLSNSFIGFSCPSGYLCCWLSSSSWPPFCVKIFLTCTLQLFILQHTHLVPRSQFSSTPWSLFCVHIDGKLFMTNCVNCCDSQSYPCRMPYVPRAWDCMTQSTRLYLQALQW